MKKIFHFTSILWQMSVTAFVANIHIAAGQVDTKPQYPIPENINKIFQTSCMPCHGNNGGRFPKSRLCFSRWAVYGAAKEAEKASLICSSVRKGKMPPKSARESHPELIPTKEQTDLICKWAETLKEEKKGK